MTTRDRLAALAYAFKSNNCLVPFEHQGEMLKADCYAHVDAMLAVLENPSEAIQVAGCPDDENDVGGAPYCYDRDLITGAYKAMIAAIREGK